MKSLAFCILAVLSAQFVQAQLFGPTGRVATPIFRAAAPAPGPSNAPIYTTTVLGAAIGGIIGSNSDKGTEGAALGGAVGLVIGQVLDRRAQKREVVRQRVGVLPPVVAANPETPSIEPPNQSIPVIDPVTGLPIQNGQLQNPALPPLPGFEQPKPTETPKRKASRLFGR